MRTRRTPAVWWNGSYRPRSSSTKRSPSSSGEYTPATRVEAPRRLPLPGTSISLPNAGGQPCGDGRPPLAYAFQTSCNTAFALIGLDLGQDVLRDQAEAFGFNDDSLGVPNLPLAAAIATVPVVIVVVYLLLARRAGAFESL